MAYLVITLPPRDITFSAAYWATFPEPEMDTFLSLKFRFFSSLMICFASTPLVMAFTAIDKT